MDRPRDSLTGEVSQKQNNKCHISLICGIQKNDTYRWAYLQRKNRDTEVENKFMDTKVGGVADGNNWETGSEIYTILCIK